MNHSAVLLEYDGPLARITLNRPEKLNAINLAWVQELEAVVRKVAAGPDARVVVVRGAGRAFCAGLDLDMLAREGMPPDLYELQERAFRGLELMEKITIAILHGYCLGGGLQLAISCDIRICSADCRIGLPAINDHIVPADNFEAGLTDVLQRYLAAPATAAVASKRLIRQAFDAPFEAVSQGSQQLLADCLASPEVEAAKKAWLQRLARRG